MTLAVVGTSDRGELGSGCEVSIFTLIPLVIIVVLILHGVRPFRRRNATRKRPSFSSLLMHAALEGDGVVMLKDGSMLAGFWFEGCDLEAASPGELQRIRHTINEMVRTLDTHWMLHVEAFHVRAHRYIGGRFNDATCALVDEERKRRAETFEMHTALFVTWRPPMFERTRWGQGLVQLFSTTDHKVEVLDVRAKQRRVFEEHLARIEQSLSIFPIARMRSTRANCQLLQALEFAINGRMRACRPPASGMFLDTYLAHSLACEATGELHHNGEHVAVVSVRGYPARGVELGDFAPLTQLDFEYRWSNRFIVLGYDASRSYFSRVRKSWERMRRSVTAQLGNLPDAKISNHADKRTKDVDAAMDDLEERDKLYGHHTAAIVVRGETREQALQRAKLVVSACKNAGYAAELELTNAFEAWRGTFPGHGYENVCKPVLTGVHYADVGPWGRDWTGPEVCPCPLYPPASPPLLQAVAKSGEAFRLSLHVGDVGHVLIVGPTGRGKSALLALMMAQHNRYPDAQAFVFDNGYSMLALANAHHDGVVYTLGDDDCPGLVPLGHIDSPADLAWAKGWVEDLFSYLNVSLTPSQRGLVHTAVEELAMSTSLPEQRTLTNFTALLQDHDLREAMREYTSGPAARVLNGSTDALRRSRFMVFELSALNKMGDKVVAPTLLYLFRELGKRLDGSPTLLCLDEAWAPLKHPRFQRQLEEWARLLRKSNTALILSTQSVLDIERSAIGSVLLESCPTRILLPNEEAVKGEIKQRYHSVLGLSEEQVKLLAEAQPKRDFLYLAPGRSRLFEVSLDPVSLSFVGVSGQRDLARLRELYTEFGKSYPPVWLEERGMSDAAERWRELSRQFSTPARAA
jgi:type IV secretion system protein TrbE